MTLSIVIIVVCLLFEGFFSGTEIAIVHANRLLLADKAEKGHLGAKIAKRYLEKPEMMLGSTLIGTNLCTVTGTTTATLLMINHFGERGEFYAILFFWPLTLLFGEIFPKALYQANADRMAPTVAILLRLFTYLLWPVVWSFTRISNLLIRILQEKSMGEPSITRGDVRALAQSRGETGDIDIEEKRFIKRMIDFSTAKVEEAMRPLIDVVAIDILMSAQDAARFANEHNHSRFPVYRDRVDQIIGTVDKMTLLNLDSEDESLRGYIKKPLFVPESMSVKNLLGDLRHKGVAMAIVVDEYGGAVGIVTVEDVLEEVIGEIEDEFDSTRPLYRKIGTNSYIFQARAEVEFINERFDFRVPEGEYETLGGFLLEKFGRIPKHGEIHTRKNLTFTVLNPTNQKLQEVRIDIKPVE